MPIKRATSDTLDDFFRKSDENKAQTMSRQMVKEHLSTPTPAITTGNKRPTLDVDDMINRGVFESAVPNEKQSSQGGLLGALKSYGQKIAGRMTTPTPSRPNDVPLIAAMRPALNYLPGSTITNAMLPTVGNAEKPGYKEAWNAGAGKVLSSAGGAAKWLGAKDVGAFIGESGNMLQKQGEKLPDDLSHNIVRAAPFTLSLIPAAVAAGFGGAEIAGAAGLGALGTFIAGAGSGALVSRSLESLLEAGGTYEEAAYRGLSEEEADQAAKSVYIKNMALTGMDAGEIILALAPLKGFGKLASTLNKTRAGRIAAGVGRVAGTAGLEAGEEGIQDVFQRQALGDPIAFDDQMKKAMTLGGVMGGGMGAAGTGYHGLKTAFENYGQKIAGAPSAIDPTQQWQDIVSAYKVPQGQSVPGQIPVQPMSPAAVEGLPSKERAPVMMSQEEIDAWSQEEQVEGLPSKERAPVMMS
ncbi:MAG: hypothetical protein ACYDG4_10555, partial [Desulfuromonadaceae bacterium]